MRILIAGCGYVGTALGKQFIQDGHEVLGLRRDPSSTQQLKQAGITPFIADLLQETSLRNLPPLDAAILLQAPSTEDDNYKKTYVDATRHALKTFKERELKRLVLISSTRVYGQHDGSWVDESTSPQPDSHPHKENAQKAKILLEAEQLVLSGGISSLVFRLGGIYGPNRNVMKRLKEGNLHPSFGIAYMNRIHLDDIVRGISFLLKKGTPGEIYLGVDDEPCTQKDFYSWIFGRLAMKHPESNKLTLPGSDLNKRCSNKKLRSLGFQFKYPSFKEGYSALLGLNV
jgi:nucleoside-diphosphate-sugar epimerase